MSRACRKSFLTLAFAIAIGTVVCGTSFLDDALVRKDQVKNVLEHQPVRGEPLCQRETTGPIETTTCDYETIESVNEVLYTNLHDLVQTPFFKYFQVDLYRECPFWQENGFCMNRECGITTVDESEIPEKWRAAALSKIYLPPADQRVQLPGCYYRDSDFCFLDDMTEGDYVDLTLVPERYTGYSGHSAHRVWRAIYEENCFGLSELNLLTGKSAAPVTLPDTLTDVLREPIDGDDTNEECLEKRVYYKIISGLHASISTHICTEWLNQLTGEWNPNLECFVTRVASHPERLQYIYFNTVLLLRAVARLSPYLSEYDYCSMAKSSLGPHDHTHSDFGEEFRTLTRLGNVMNIAKRVGKFDERVLFRGENANILKQEFKQHFRNVSRIMDCIGCDKCRLWGKVQTTGLATALKVLFEMDEKALDPHQNQNLLQRSEVVALINTLHRFSESLHAVEQFREMWKKTGDEDSERLIYQAEKAVGGNPRRTTSHQPSSKKSREAPSTDPLPPPSDSLPTRLQLYLLEVLESCRRDTLTYFGSLSDIWQRLSKTVFPLRTEL
ncbi:endoplasmic oxidoreductin [Gyrodon lividus]|nr:endoplasmic oxidoreductin [Gyrodon lividus]